MATAHEIRERVLSHASENSALLVTLSATSEAPSVLNAHVLHMARLQDSVLQQEETLSSLTTTVETKFKSHRKYRDSITRRFLYRATRMLAKFEAKADMEEKDYFTVLRDKSKAEERLNALQADFQDAEREQVQLERSAKRHEDTHAAIDRLYEAIFAGPTPGFPVEDGKENAYYSARSRNEAQKESIRAARRAMRLLKQAETNMRRAGNHLQRAEFQAREAILFLDDAEISLRRGNEYTGYALTNIDSAGRELRPPFPAMAAVQVGVIAKLNEARGVDDGAGAASREELYVNIARSREALEAAREQLKSFMAVVGEREESQLQGLRRTARAYEDARQALQQERQVIFETVAGFGVAAPSYTECCDRAAAFCEVPADQPPTDPGDEAAAGDDIAEGRQQEQQGSRAEPSLPTYVERAAEGETSVATTPVAPSTKEPR